MKIIIDSRETRPLAFRASGTLEGTEIRKLDVGDYSIAGFEDKIAVERKDPNDLFGTLGKSHNRFKRELERAKSLDYFAIVVDCSFSNIRDKTFEGAHWSQMRGDVIIQILSTLELKYGFPVHYCKDRNESASLIRNLLKAYWKLQGGK